MGKSAPKAPDYTPTAEASNYAVDVGKQQFDQQSAFAREQWDYYKPIMEEITGTQTESMRQQMGLAQDSYEYQKGFRDVEQELVAKAQKFNTEAYREGLAQQAKADTERAFASQDAALERQLLSMGAADPSSGKFQGLARSQNIQQAGMSAAAMNATRGQARDQGQAMLAGAAGLGRGMQTSLAAYSGALNAGNSAGQNAMAGGNNYMANMGAANQAGLGWHQQGMAGYGDIMGTQASIYNNQTNANAEMTGAIVGGAMSMAGGFMSDVRLKENIDLIGQYPNGMNQYEFNYRADPAKQRYRGVMAQEVELTRPDAVVTDEDGYKSVIYDLLDIKMEKV